MKKLNRRDFIKITTLGSAALIGGAMNILPWRQRPDPVSAASPENTYLPAVFNHASPVQTGPIIADHTVVDRFADIPQEYKLSIRNKWVNVVGESHSAAYRNGCQYLNELDGSFKANASWNPPNQILPDMGLRVSKATWGNVSSASGWTTDGYGEEDWFTSTLAVERTRAHLTYSNTHNFPIAAIGFGWCWDMCRNLSSTMDPVYKVRWAGSSVGGPSGDRPWGLDSGDYELTGNYVCMDTYLNATVEFMNHCRTNGYPTRVFFTTGPVDSSSYNTGEVGYQRHLKHEYMRNFVKADSSRILFDYADILCWSNANQENLVNWTDYGGTNQVFPYIHPDNMLDRYGNYSEADGHIGYRGALRLAKALWWMLARLEGWNGT